MAFGGLRTTFKNSATSIGTSLAATGSQAVRLGDLVFVVGGEQLALTITGVTDNLGNSYTSCNNTVNDAGTSTGRAFWARVKDDGTLTTVTIACNGGTNNGVIVVAIIEGPITTIDSDPANAANADLSSPFVCPTTGTLGQANEIVVGFLVGTGSTVNTATAPNLLADQQATAAILHATIGYQAVTATTAVTPTFAAGSNPTDQLMGVASFRRDNTPLGAGKRLGMLDFPNPRGLVWPFSLLTWTEPLNLPLYVPPAEPEVTYLPSVAVWGPPPPDVRHPNVLQTWANELNLPLNSPGTPFVPPEWTVPQGFATKGGVWINPAIQAAAVEPPDTTNLPSVASGWPVPPDVQRITRPYTFSFSLPLTLTAPFRKLDWPNPRTTPFSVAPQFVNRLPLAPTAAPFKQTDWPNPRGLAPTKGWVYSKPPEAAAVVADTYLPSVASGWSVPPALPRPAGLSFVGGLPPVQFVTRAPLIARHNEQSWHVALKPQFVNLLPMAPVPPAPFNKLDWPNPRESQRNAVHRAWSYGYQPGVLDPNTYRPGTVTGWTIPVGLSPLGLSFTVSFSLPLNVEGVEPPIEPPDFPPHPPPTDSGGAGIKSGVWKPGQRGKRENYRSYRFLAEKEIEQLTGSQIRQSARDLRADVRQDPSAPEIAREIEALSRVVNTLADIDRLEASVAELSRAIEYARKARAEADAEDEEVSFLLLS